VGGFKGCKASNAADSGKRKGIHCIHNKERDSMASQDCGKKAGKAGFGKLKHTPGKNNNEWYALEVYSLKVSVRVSREGGDERYDELEATLPSKTEAWCGDTQSKICSQLTHDGIGLSFTTCTQYMSKKWCKEANSAKSKSTIIRGNRKTWRLSIVMEEPKHMKKIEMDICRDESENFRNRRAKKRMKTNKVNDCLEKHSTKLKRSVFMGWLAIKRESDHELKSRNDESCPHKVKETRRIVVMPVLNLDLFYYT
jgi:hypothetical protein